MDHSIIYREVTFLTKSATDTPAVAKTRMLRELRVKGTPSAVNSSKTTQLLIPSLNTKHNITHSMRVDIWARSVTRRRHSNCCKIMSDGIKALFPANMVSWGGTHVFIPRAHKLGTADAYMSNTVTVKIR